MADKTSETAFLDFFKKADSDAAMTVRESTEREDDRPAVEFSDVAQEGNKDTREGVTNRTIGSKSKSDVAEKALVGNILSTRDFETSNIQVKPVEKVSFPRSLSLMETVLNRCGRL